MTVSSTGEGFAITATSPGGTPIPVAYHVTLSGGDDSSRTALILPHQKRWFVREYGHEDGWTVTFRPLLELPEELLVSWCYTRLREWVTKDDLRTFDEIAARAMIAHRDREESQ